MNEFIASLHRYGRFWIVAGLSVFLVVIVVLCMFDFDEEMMLIAIILGLMLSWEFSDIQSTTITTRNTERPATIQKRPYR